MCCIQWWKLFESKCSIGNWWHEAIYLSSNTEDILSTLIDYHCLIKPKAAMDQFAEGLQWTGVLHYIKHHDSLLRDQFRYQLSVLTAGKYRFRWGWACFTKYQLLLTTQGLLYCGESILVQCSKTPMFCLYNTYVAI